MTKVKKNVPILLASSMNLEVENKSLKERVEQQSKQLSSVQSDIVLLERLDFSTIAQIEYMEKVEKEAKIRENLATVEGLKAKEKEKRDLGKALLLSRLQLEIEKEKKLSLYELSCKLSLKSKLRVIGCMHQGMS